MFRPVLATLHPGHTLAKCQLLALSRPRAELRLRALQFMCWKMVLTESGGHRQCQETETLFSKTHAFSSIPSPLRLVRTYQRVGTPKHFAIRKNPLSDRSPLASLNNVGTLARSDVAVTKGKVGFIGMANGDS
jgi:hypothetical protein